MLESMALLNVPDSTSFVELLDRARRDSDWSDERRRSPLCLWHSEQDRRQPPRQKTFPRWNFIIFAAWNHSRPTTVRSVRASKLCWVLMSTPDNQQPKPGWEWYQPTTISGRPVCFNISSIFDWKTGSTASTLTPVPDWGMANTSVTLTV